MKSKKLSPTPLYPSTVFLGCRCTPAEFGFQANSEREGRCVPGREGGAFPPCDELLKAVMEQEGIGSRTSTAAHRRCFIDQNLYLCTCDGREVGR